MANATTQQRGDQPVIATQQLTKVFKDFWMRPRVRAVDALDMSVYRGEIYGLLGPNGSGKSTVIKILLGLLRKTSGRVAVFGKPPSDVSVKKRIGVLPEESYLYPFLNARETLEFYGKLFELEHSVRKRRIDELLDMVGLLPVAHRQVREYSKGMQRRIGLAQALINDPELLILDEPTTGLDPLGTRQVKDLILQLGRRGKTILLSSHQLSDVEDVVDRLSILYGGRKQAEGTPDELLVASTHTLIETEALTDEQVAEIDRVLHGSQRAVLRVSKPRQRLEELFVNIVENAREQRVETGGALSGGGTAAFLRAEEAEEAGGEALIESLTREEAPEQAPPEPVKPAREAEEPAPEVLDQLMGAYDERDEPERPSGDDAPPKAARDQQPEPERPEGVDDSVISSLLDEDRGRKESDR